MNIPETNQPRIVIIGGGFGGMNLIKKLKKTDYQVVLLDKRNFHTFQPLLYQVSTSGLEPESIAYPLRKIIRKQKNMHFRLAEVHRIDTQLQKVRTDIGDLHYDHLVIATGTRTNFFGNKTIEENAIWMKSLPQALNIRSLMFENLEKANRTEDPVKRKELLRFVIAGAGPTGVELSGAFAELRSNVLQADYPDMDTSEIEIHLIEGADRVLPPFSKQSSEKAQKFLEEMGVTIHLETFVGNYENNRVTTKGDLVLDTATFIWSAGVTGASIEGFEETALLPKLNRYKVDRYNRVAGFQNIYAIGDIALMETEDFPKGHPQLAQPAIQQGKNLAKNFKKMLRKEELEPFKYFDKGSMATIGRNKAVVDMGKIHFGGFLAWFIWMFIHLWFLVGFRNRVVTFFNWTYSYLNYDKAARLIVRPFKQNKIIAEED
ncbi:NAD(P)/FAD-dependent oxidoreductase [Leeuwenhoekiella palythoae]|uniref:NADH:ubiquinone reductase (non-electrogenic) n=1 Tax=Leeuwenhoekiella palythoae TaxID=573501 RepID=A0A1M5SJE6_9FLAO|nr:NAD(P)/FAD-dependent oxidoreductase [Leeuwenhoekiella palythoae]MEC8682562.1 NAD(P)/FAD-dependent oxidoreductase [Bacteroidota bacterium]MEE3225162.1 NAD(P)/FAD-dependent oxidoreductase [Bacteroidota bacterium]MEE3244043.1 NAD(P)/FAD-dependent oxidoreductase [Bacteroidota bacterium]RXG28944.1 NADH dehydrogenase FAD-containing subunit [Leeuwenhoekiella palythoae]UBZ10103.1 NAD(P)/FAD-dependent oxidoreductase [Leeuwenhoekiella palythoae]